MEKEILKLFLTNNNLKFNEIEKSLKTRSNKLNYHLKKLIQKNILEKEKEFYKLTKTSEYLIPYVSEKNSVLPVILILIGNKKRVFLCERNKRPYKNKLSLPGGRMILGETISQSVKRIMEEKHNINASLKKINSISLEHIKNKNKIIHSFLLILVTAYTKERISLEDLEKNKKRIIPSDYNLIKDDFNKKIIIKIIKSKTDKK
jgi:ADP-ribose pyrophosphatase YjhB (NUDIX family)